LAVIETKVILVLTVKELGFTAQYDRVKIESRTSIGTVDEYADGKPGSGGMTVEGHRPYQIPSERCGEPPWWLAGKGQVAKLTR